ncbi:hypothetical protein Prudu_017037 [Prunus dulcis]|uniref:No apical meristem-associated C-terminal domain-containing protein n=1 Tax=Prunus dulcis TaxID=3755 RepID=A0A4Y1RMS2_PRUDU|nr:hypothetical protein Prudu_017037 [Prunus dulcis]
MIQAQMWFGATGQGKKSFNHFECWEVNYSHGSGVVLNETPLRDSTTSNSPFNSPMSQDSPIGKELRPIGQKAAKARKRNAIRIEMEQKRQENEMAIQAEYAREREYVRKKICTRRIGKPWTMDTSHMSPKQNNFGS